MWTNIGLVSRENKSAETFTSVNGIKVRRNNIGDYYKYKVWFEQDILDGWF